jgi:adenosyl cobinamide kinase/adenosyl cobinamide phosphate guanylyltransferase
MAKEGNLIEDVLLEIIENSDTEMGMIENLKAENRPVLLDAVTAILTSVTKLENIQWTVEKSVPVQLIDMLDQLN